MSQVTWTTFFTILFFIVLAYYLIIMLLYYRRGFHLSFFNNLWRRPFKLNRERVDTAPVAANGLSIADFIQQTARQGLSKGELLAALRAWLHANSAADWEVFADTKDINQQIAAACQQYCSIHLSEEDLRVLWV